MSAIWLILCLLNLIIQIVLCDIKDFIVEKEADLQRFGHKNDVALNDESLYYDDEDNELEMYDDCHGGGGAGVYDDEQVTLEDYMMMGDNNWIMSDYFEEGQIKMELLQKLINQWAKNPKYAQLLAQGAGYDEGFELEIPNSCAAQDPYSLEIIE